MLTASTTFCNAIREFRGNADQMVSLGLAERTSRSEFPEYDFPTLCKLCVIIGILAGRYENNPEAFIMHFEKEVLNG